MKSIICGAGEVGKSIAEKLSNEGIDVTVIDESKEKLTAIKPETLGQASRIGGVRSSDLAVLSMELFSQKHVSRETK